MKKTWHIQGSVKKNREALSNNEFSMVPSIATSFYYVMKVLIMTTSLFDISVYLCFAALLHILQYVSINTSHYRDDYSLWLGQIGLERLVQFIFSKPS